MTPQEIQRTMDFILRSQADAVIRMERWDERSAEQQQKIDDLIVAVREAAKAIHEAAKSIREHERRIRSLEKSQRQTAGREGSMKDIIGILTRLEARQAKRLDRLETGSHRPTPQVRLIDGFRRVKPPVGPAALGPLSARGVGRQGSKPLRWFGRSAP